MEISTVIELYQFFGQGGIRTPDTVVRSHVLWSTELQALFKIILKRKKKAIPLLFFTVKKQCNKSGKFHFFAPLKRLRVKKEPRGCFYSKEQKNEKNKVFIKKFFPGLFHFLEKKNN